MTHKAQTDERRRRILAAFHYHREPEGEQGCDTPEELAAELAASRYLIVEAGVPRFAGRIWYTSGDDPLRLMRDHDEQEGGEDWYCEALYDLDTGEDVQVERRYMEAQRVGASWLAEIVEELRAEELPAVAGAAVDLVEHAPPPVDPNWAGADAAFVPESWERPAFGRTPGAE